MSRPSVARACAATDSCLKTGLGRTARGGEHAGGLAQNVESQTYAHRLKGTCGCGGRHGATPVEERRIVATYDYQDADGKLLYQVVRYEPKGFAQRRPDGAGGWRWDLRDVKPVLYHLPDLLAAPADSTVYLCEGEKDCGSLRALGL
ncbi:MAG: hypothetical protein ABIN58_11775, partial [candidate division WOR-3 bacterium]